MSGRTRAVRSAGVVLVTVLLAGGWPALAPAVPPPPPNPSDQDIDGARAGVGSSADEVGRLANRLAEADSELSATQAEVELAYEETNRARMELSSAREDARAAQEAAAVTGAEAAQVDASFAEARKQLDAFAAASYRQGSTIGSVSAFLGATSPEDVLARASLLDAVSGSQLDALDTIRRARVEKVNADSTARAALETVQAKQRSVEQAAAAADSAYQAAINAETTQAVRAQELQAQKAGLERELFDAQQAVRGLEGQRQRYEDWQAAQQAEQAAAQAALVAAAQAAQAASPLPDSAASGSSDGASPGPGAGPDRVQAVINRALSQVGVPYAWGGGDRTGPTLGIRDGGVADSFGDFNKVGFDCSGLLIYAFAPALGRSLPHYSGAQYDSGRKIPVAQRQPGDLLAWATRGRIHHIALYIGNGLMVEARQSGTNVMVSRVRTGGGLMPYATRLL